LEEPDLQQHTFYEEVDQEIGSPLDIPLTYFPSSRGWLVLGKLASPQAREKRKKEEPKPKGITISV